MVVEFDVGKATFTMEEMTEECLERLLDNKMFSLFMPPGHKDVIRKRFNKCLENGEWREA